MLTIFVGTFNRLDTLTRTLDSFRPMMADYQVVIVDNGTDNEDCLDLLAYVETLPEVKKVYQLDKVFSMEALTDNYTIALKDQYPVEKGWYAVTDADICFEGSSPWSFDAYLQLAEHTGGAAGPHMRFDAGIPYGYPLRSRVLATESWIYYREMMNWYKSIPYSGWPIDTTFHVFPATDEFRRLKMDTVRVGPPYDAMHLDWYLNIFSPTKENSIYITSRAGIGSWGKSWISDFWWRFQESRVAAFEHMLTVTPVREDLCTASFIISWCYQMGVGGEPDLGLSSRWLHGAIPLRFTNFWAREREWMQMIYENDFRGFGWS